MRLFDCLDEAEKAAQPGESVMARDGAKYRHPWCVMNDAEVEETYQMPYHFRVWTLWFKVKE